MSRTELMRRGVNLKRLTDKQRIFVREYLVHFDGARAARAAGYSRPSVAASKLLNAKRSPLVAKAVGKALHERIEGLKLTRENVLQELAYSVLRDPLDMCDKNGMISIDDMRKLPEHLRHCIDGIKAHNHYTDGELTGQTIELKLTAKLGAIELAMKHLGLLSPEQVKITHAVDWDSLIGGPEVIDVVAQRLSLEEGNGKCD